MDYLRSEIPEKISENEPEEMDQREMIISEIMDKIESGEITKDEGKEILRQNLTEYHNGKMKGMEGESDQPDINIIVNMGKQENRPMEQIGNEPLSLANR